MQKRVFALIALLASAILISCTANVFVETADQSGDESLYYSALSKINSSDFDGAITDIGSMTASYSATRDIQFLLASAYAGKCGFVQFDVLDQLGTLGATNLFLHFMQQNTGATLNQVTACITAEDTLQAIGAAADRNASENMFMMLLGLHKIGVITSYNADSSPADGTLDPAFDACNTGDISDLHAQHVAIGMNEFILSFAQVGASFGGDSSADLTAACTALAGLGAGFDICSNLEPADYDTADEMRSARTIIHEGDSIGLGSCTAGPPEDIANCLCP